MMRISELKYMKSDMDDLYNELSSNIEIFFLDPSHDNKKFVRERFKEFNHMKNVLANKINDFWCKGE